MTLKDGMITVFRVFRDESSRQLGFEITPRWKEKMENDFIKKSADVLNLAEKVFAKEFPELAQLEEKETITKQLLKEYMVEIIMDTLSKEDPKSVSIEEAIIFKLAVFQSLRFFQKIAGDLQNRKGPLDEYLTFTTLN